MGEDKKPKTDYASNSAKSKKEAKEASDRPQVQQIASGAVRKKGVGTKFKETFVGDSAESVFQYVLFDIIIPRTKDLLFETFTGGLERSLFGTSTRSSRGRRSSLVDKTDYRGLSQSARDKGRDRETVSRSRQSQNFEEIVIPTRGEAEQTLDTLRELVDQYDAATLADYYGLLGVSTEHTDLKFGWTDLDEVPIEPARGGGYILMLPRVEVL